VQVLNYWIRIRIIMTQDEKQKCELRDSSQSTYKLCDDLATETKLILRIAGRGDTPSKHNRDILIREIKNNILEINKIVSNPNRNSEASQEFLFVNPIACAEIGKIVYDCVIP